MKHRLSLFSVLAALTLLAACSWSGSDTTKNSDAQAAPKVRVFNVLSKALYDDAHIKGSKHLDFGKVIETANAEGWGKQDTIVFYCSNFQCSASKVSAQDLQALGFKNAKAYEGGMEEWYRLSKEDPTYAFEGKAQEEYLNIPLEKVADDAEESVACVTAPELKSMMQEAGLLN